MKRVQNIEWIKQKNMSEGKNNKLRRGGRIMAV